MNRDSGRQQGKRAIKGGRGEIRQVLYMAPVPCHIGDPDQEVAGAVEVGQVERPGERCHRRPEAPVRLARPHVCRAHDAAVNARADEVRALVAGHVGDIDQEVAGAVEVAHIERPGERRHRRPEAPIVAAGPTPTRAGYFVPTPTGARQRRRRTSSGASRSSNTHRPRSPDRRRGHDAVCRTFTVLGAWCGSA